jgi:arsenate reductase
MPGTRKRVLLLCSGNSARSQMAEALITHYLGDRWEARSAGTTPAGHVHPLALQALAEHGIQITNLRSKAVDEFRGERFDHVITLCDAAAEACPVWLQGGCVHHIGFADPAQASDSPGGQLEAFRRVRDGIREAVLGYLRAADGAEPCDDAKEPARGRTAR